VPQLRLLAAGFPPRRSGLDPGSSHVGSMVARVALGQIFAECSSFLCLFSFIIRPVIDAIYSRN
jgi:hypothetical protein